MGKIVIVTTKGKAKCAFVNTVHSRSHSGVALVIIQRQKTKGILRRIIWFLNKIRVREIVPECMYFILLMLDKSRRRALSLTKPSTIHGETDRYEPPVLEVDDINSEVAYKNIAAIAPSILAIWGGLIIKEDILKLAKISLNMHAGYCPYYRGSNGNLNAILRDDLKHIGITLHEAVAKVDAGKIYKIITTDTDRAPSIFFRDLNEQAVEAYINVILAIHCGEYIQGEEQDLSLGKNYMLKDWTYQKQYKVAGKILELEKKYA